MRGSRHGARFWLAGAALLVAGCAASETGGAACASDDECREGAICQASRCVDACGTASDCGADRICVSGACIEPAPCASAEDCRADEVCETWSGRGRVCIPQEPECDRDSDCPPRQVCDRGACVQGGDSDAGDAGDLTGDPDATPAEVGDSDVGGCDADGDCEVGQRCVARACVVDADIAEEADVTPVDAVECLSTSECGPGMECIFRRCQPIDATPVDAAGSCGGRAEGRYPSVCDAASDCCNGLCLGNPGTGTGICTQECDGWEACNPVGIAGDYFCYDTGTSGRLCAVSDWGRSCNSASQCIGQRCLVANADRACTWDCEATSDCVPGSVCGLVAFDSGGGEPTLLRVCTPIGETCELTNDCLSGTCLTDDFGRNGYCSTFCDDSDRDACPVGYACVEIDVTLPPVCVRG